MVMFLVRHPMVIIFLNLFVLLECPVILMTLIFVIIFGPIVVLLVGSFTSDFSVAIFVSSHVCFILVLIFDFCVSKIMHLGARNLPRKV